MIRLLVRFVILCTFLWVVGLFLFTFSVRQIQPYEGSAEAAVVFTGGGGRVDAGLRLLSEGRVQHLLISGVHPNVKVAELLRMNRQPDFLAQRIDLGFSAQDTLGNADETAEWVQRNKFLSLIVVTAYYHMPRAKIHLGTQLPNVAIYSYPVMPKNFTSMAWLKDPAIRRSMIADYNKFLLTYPQIILLRYKN